MIEKSVLVAAFARNLGIAEAQAQGLTHSDSLIQPPFRGNCFNWVLGHLVGHRDRILEALGAEKIMGSSATRYARESAPVTGADPDVIPLERLLDLMRLSGEALAAALQQTSAEDLGRTLRIGQNNVRVADLVFFLYFHETYHVGQLELLRQLAGKDDKII